MEHSTDLSIRKILIDYSEYERLKHIEEQFINSNKTQRVKSFQNSSKKVQDQTGEGQLGNQGGEGSSSTEVSASSIQPPTSTLEPTAIQSNSSVLHYDVNLLKNDLNDAFDESKLLTLIPKLYLKNAKTLLKEFNTRSSELTWNSSGTLFINQSAVPLSNIFVLFPLLFKRNPPKIEGFEEFLQKITDMGLHDLVVAKPLFKNLEANEIIVDNKPKVFENNPSGEGDTNIAKNSNEIEAPWWYIGD